MTYYKYLTQINAVKTVIYAYCENSNLYCYNKTRSSIKAWTHIRKFLEMRRKIFSKCKFNKGDFMNLNDDKKNNIINDIIL